MQSSTNPYSTNIASSLKHNGNEVGSYDKESEEAGHKAPKILPFNFNAAQELLSRLYIDAIMLKTMITAAEKNTQIKRSKIKPVIDAIDNVNVQITQTIPELLAILEL